MMTRSDTAAALPGDAITVAGLSQFFQVADNAAASGGMRIVRAIEDVSLTIPPHRFVSIVGPSGCGKTTLLNILAGLEPIQIGEVSVARARPAAGRREVAFMQVRDALLPWRTVEANAGFGLEVRGMGRSERAPIVAGMLQSVGLAQFAQARPRQLSQGMRQRVALARTFALDSEILLMDEPFGALDAQTKQQLQSVLLDLWEHDKRTVVLVTHDLQEAITLSDTIVVMSARPGRIKRIFEVGLQRPRIVGELLGTPAFTELYQQLRLEVEETDS